MNLFYTNFGHKAAGYSTAPPLDNAAFAEENAREEFDCSTRLIHIDCKIVIVDECCLSA